MVVRPAWGLMRRELTHETRHAIAMNTCIQPSGSLASSCSPIEIARASAKLVGKQRRPS
jgi:hypothetical protein